MEKCKGAFRVTNKEYIKNIVNALQSNEGLLFEFDPFESGIDINLSIFTAEYLVDGRVVKKSKINLQGAKNGHSKDTTCNDTLITNKEFDFIHLHRTTAKMHFAFELKADFQLFFAQDQENHFYIVGSPFMNRDGKIYFSLWLELQEFYDQEMLISKEEFASQIDIDNKNQKDELISKGVLYLKPCPPHWEPKL